MQPSGPAEREEMLRAIRHQLEVSVGAQLGHILLRNFSAFFAFSVGAFPAGFLTAAGMLILGVQVGMSLVRSPLALGHSPSLVTALLVPHGILEMTAFFLSAGAGLRGAGFVLTCLDSGDLPRRAEIAPILWQIALGAGLLAAAALVEVFVTPHFIRGCLPA